MKNLVMMVYGWCVHLSLFGPNYFVAGNALRVQGLLQKMFPKYFPNSPFSKR